MAITAMYRLNGNANASVGTNGSDNSVAWVPGKNGECGSFNGSNSYVSISNSGFSITSDFTLSALVKCTSLNSEANVIGKDGPIGGRDFQFRLNSNGTITFFRGDTANGGYCDFSTTDTFNDGKYHHVSAKFDSVNGSAIVVDGKVRATNGVTSGKSLSSSNCQIGARGDYVNLFTGNIDDVRIFNDSQPVAKLNNLTMFYNGFF